MNDRIQPRTLKGFRDFLPEAALTREWVLDTARAVCRSYGYSPIDTPALEYSEILLGKGSDESDKQLYRFEDHGGRDVAMRFDLTVPLARFVAQHAGALGTPFKRYHAGVVWRGENTQRGRYREFMQFDFDTIGSESIVADVETMLLTIDLFTALGFEVFTVRVNNRKVLNGVLEGLGVADRSVAVLRALDKLAKIGTEAVAAELVGEAGTTPEQAYAILEVASVHGSNDAVLAGLNELVTGTETGERGLTELRDLVSGVAAGGGSPHLAVDPSIARGLDYYTGTVFETTLDELAAIGSVCSGGRYDDLASLYTRQRLPGIGGSLGVDRLLAAMEELQGSEGRATPGDVLVVYFEAARRDDYVALAAELRRAGLAVEMYPEPKKLGGQLKYADRRGHRLAVIVGTEEWAAGTAQVKVLATGARHDVERADLVATCRRLLD
jgi:histidyl-tRNA synthetase